MYANAGIAVFPCRSRDTMSNGKLLKAKTPLVESWPRDSSSDPAVVEKMWEKYPDALIAIDCGKSNLLVVDQDRHDGGMDGVAFFSEVAVKHDYSHTGPAVKTASGGRHFYFCQPDDQRLGNSAGAFTGYGIDVRGSGGYVIAPESVLADGRSWRKDLFAPDLIKSFRDGVIPTLPDWLAQELRTKRSKRNTGDKTTNSDQEVAINPDATDAEYAIDLLEIAANELAATSKGYRNRGLYDAAFKMGMLAAGGDLTRDTAMAALRHASEINGSLAEDGVAQFRASFRSGFEDGVRSVPKIDFKDERGENDGDDRREPPRPLYREPGEPEPFPIDAFGEVLANAARAIVDFVQVPEAIAGQSVLAAATLATQAHCDVVLPIGDGLRKPLSEFFITIAESGDRKTAADDLALAPIFERENELRAEFAADQAEHDRLTDAYNAARKEALKIVANTPRSPEDVADALAELGGPPKQPLNPMIVCTEPTYEGFVKTLKRGQPSMGLCSSEGGQFAGGHGMNTENRLKTASGMSLLWDGAAIKRVRAGDGADIISGRRVMAHLMMQPMVASTLLADPILKDQGWLSRCLVVAPKSLAGTRFQKRPASESANALRRYNERLSSILTEKPTLLGETQNELDPDQLTLTKSAQEIWRDFADEVERELSPQGKYSQIRGFAGKLPEHAARLAGVLTLTSDMRANKITSDEMERGVILARFYASESLRLIGVASISPELRKARLLLDWLHTHKIEAFGIRDIYNRGPNSIRAKDEAQNAAAVLEDHGWLARIKGGLTDAKGCFHKLAWNVAPLPETGA